MELMDLLNLGAKVIQGNKDDATTGIDTATIAKALGDLMGNSGASAQGGEGGLDLGSIVGMLAGALSAGAASEGAGELADIVGSWIGSGANKPITPDQAGELVGSDRLNQFAQALGLNQESAKTALADALPQMVDQATNADSSLASTLLDQVGGVGGAIDMFGKLMGKA
ncbi:MAG: hypothetical protein KN64_08885 [Sulfurovum sp. AS07-7]|nr:MAG: hypothetical protein KN64_08885 [Sulfurovum sp. AS07-7]